MKNEKVIKKQNNSRYCLLCGFENPMSLKARFYELESGEIVSVVQPREEHQSYPGRLHGGIAATILDETIGRAMNITEPENWGVTVSLNLDYKKPVPLDCELKAVARITRNTRKIFEGTGELLLPNGDIAVTAWGKYMKIPIDQIAEGFLEENEWYYIDEALPESIEIENVLNINENE